MLLVKICLLGEAAVGKTSLRRSFLGERFDTSYLITIGADFAVKTVQRKDGKETIRFQIWDLAGQAKFSNVRDLYYRGSLGALTVFDITRPETLNVLEFWIDELYKCAGKVPVPVIVLGNKTDLRNECDNPVDPTEAENFAKAMTKKYDIGIIYMETSAKEGLNVEKAFIELGNRIIEDSRLYLED
ncbi:MAG: Rab family GTPase [Candidatus Odinarchaeota archaeon]